jgi:hypothetical protein
LAKNSVSLARHPVLELTVFIVTPSLEFVIPRLSNPNISAHRARELKKTSTKYHPKRGSQWSLRPKTQPKRSEAKSLALRKQTSQIHKYHKQPNHTYPQSPMPHPSKPGGPKAQRGSHRPKRRCSPSLSSFQTLRLHHQGNTSFTIKINTSRPKPSKTSNKILRKKSKLSLKMSWCAFA